MERVLIVDGVINASGFESKNWKKMNEIPNAHVGKWLLHLIVTQIDFILEEKITENLKDVQFAKM